jgi:signal transduction histidine kinase
MVTSTMAHGRGREEPSREALNILWGMVRILEEPERARIELIWGLVSLETKRAKHAPQIEADGAAVPTDPIEAAMNRTQERMANLQAACIIGSVSAALFYLSYLTPAAREFWGSFWFVSGLVTGAVASGLVLSLFGEGFRRRWLSREIADATRERDAHRAISSGQTQAVQELTASIAHEIRNPITAAKSLVQQMGEDPNSSDNVGYAGIALEELERVERSVSNLLRFARDEQIEPADMLLGDAVGSALEAVAERADAAGVAVKFESDSQGPILGDAEKLRRVFLNLLDNAIDAMEQGGTRAPELQVQIGENLGRTEVWARVKDNGPGIEAGRVAKIWTPFHTSKETGTGLGLPICKKIVEGHDGTIDVSSSPGAGADFVLTFPKRS